MPEELELEIASNKGLCFVMMPHGETADYEDRHFTKIYEQIFKPAIEKAGYTSYRTDESKSSCLIQASIIKDLIEAPMALFDLTTRDPNVLYALGIRHALNKPVVLVQEVGTDRIFDIYGINVLHYRPTRIYDEVFLDREMIINTIEEKGKDTIGKHSFIKLIQVNLTNFSEENVDGDNKLEGMLDREINEPINHKSGIEKTNVINFIDNIESPQNETRSNLNVSGNSIIDMKKADLVLTVDEKDPTDEIIISKLGDLRNILNSGINSLTDLLKYKSCLQDCYEYISKLDAENRNLYFVRQELNYFNEIYKTLTS